MMTTTEKQYTFYSVDAALVARYAQIHGLRCWRQSEDIVHVLIDPVQQSTLADLFFSTLAKNDIQYALDAIPFAGEYIPAV